MSFGKVIGPSSAATVGDQSLQCVLPPTLLSIVRRIREREDRVLTRRTFVSASATVAALAKIGPAAAQTLRKPVRIVVGFPAGGGTDVIARMIAEKLRGHYAPAVIVDNRPGAAARIAVAYVKNAEPDGTTLLFTPDFPLTVYPHSYKKLDYDPLRDLLPVTACAKSMLTFNAGPGLPAEAKTVADFIGWCPAPPVKAQYGTTSPGATPHFVGVMLARAAGIELTPVHYKGGARRCRTCSAATFR